MVSKNVLKNKTMFTLLCKIVEERIFLHKHCAGNRILQFWTNSVKCIYNAVNLCFRKYFSYTEMLNRSMCIMKCLIGLILHNLERNFFRGAPLLNKYKNVFRISSPGISNSAIHVWPIAYNMCQGSSFLFCFMLQNITKVILLSIFFLDALASLRPMMEIQWLTFSRLLQ